MSVELMPPVDIDKGLGVGSLGATGCTPPVSSETTYPDLDAFKALDRLRVTGPPPSGGRR